MLVAELIQPFTFQLTDQPLTDPAPGEVQVHIDSVGICGSDLHSYSEGAIGDMACVYPMVLGHEPSGTVVKVGAGVSGWAPGDRAALEPALYCYHCEFCQSGHHNVCQHIRFMSNPGYPGYFREFANLPVHNLLAIPPELPIDLATVVEPLGVAMHSMKFARIELGETVAVFGGGPIGLLTVAALRAAGAGRIWLSEPLAHRRELARHMGADVVLDPTEVDVAQQIMADTGKRGVDCAIDCAAKEHTTNEAIRSVRNAGRMVLTGIHSASMVPFEVSPMRRKELAIFNVRRSNHESEAALQLIVRRPDLFAPMLTHTRPLASISDAFQLNFAYQDSVGKLIIKP